jgi:hypothetical protein
MSHLVYLDAWVPERGQSIADIWGWDVMGQLEEAAAAQGDSERVRAVVELFGIEDSADLEWATPKFSPQPLAPVKTPLDYRTPLEERRRFTRTYLRAVHGPDPFGATAARLKDNPAWRVVGIDTGHDVMLTRPEELTAILLETADGRDGTSPEQRGEQTVTS